MLGRLVYVLQAVHISAGHQCGEARRWSPGKSIPPGADAERREWPAAASVALHLRSVPTKSLKKQGSRL